MPLILDNILVFLYWIVRQWIIEMRTRSWPITTGTIEGGLTNSAMYPRATVEYSFRLNDETYGGKFDKPFWYRKSAETFADRILPLSSLRIRYRPESPSRSFVRVGDQQPSSGM